MKRTRQKAKRWGDDRGKELTVEKKGIQNEKVVRLAWLILILAFLIIIYSMTLYAFLPSESTHEIWNYAKIAVFPATIPVIVVAYYKEGLKPKA